MRSVAEDEDRHFYAARAKLQRFIKAGHGKIVRARGLKQARHGGRAVAVVGLDDAEEAAPGRKRGADGHIVMAQVFQG